MKFSVLTLFPEMFAPVRMSMLGRAEKSGIIDIDLVNIRDYSTDKHKKTDDVPFGGGNGMIMMPEPLTGALRSVGAEGKRVLYMSPRGKVMDEQMIRDFSEEEELVIVCGHYEGVDQRVIDAFSMEEVSIGDYIMTGGEIPAMALIDSVSRLLPGVLASEEAAYGESVYSGLLEYPQYTKPREYERQSVPEVLVSGDHERIRLWNFEQSLRLTKERRPDLFDAYVRDEGPGLSKKERKILEEVITE